MKWIALSALLLVSACGGASEEEEPEENTPSAEALYNDALDTFAAKKYRIAIEEFEEVDKEYPYSPWATRAQVMAAYSAYSALEFADSIAILERFVRLNPAHEQTPYAYYLLALSYYDQISDVGRDQRRTRQARQALGEVVARYPNSDYARDAKLKIDLTSDHLAGKEMDIGRYYLRQDEYVAAINRFKFVVQKYDTTSHAPEALHRLVEVHLRLGLRDEAKRYGAVLGYNYPGSDWYEFSFAMLDGDVNPEDAEGKDESSWLGLL